MKNFISNLQFVFKPHYWVMKDSYNKLTDETLKHLLKTQDLVVIDQYWAKLGNLRIWVENQPYGMFVVNMGDGFSLRGRASRLTLKDFYEKLNTIIAATEKEQLEKVKENK